MVQLKLLIFTLAFSELIVHLDASCPKGKRVFKSGCAYCGEGTFQPEENYPSKTCKACRQCDENSGSVFREKCTKERNAICQCRAGFVPSDSDFSTCKCDIGFGLIQFGDSGLPECKKCEDGYFSTTIDVPCKKWTDCKSAGVKRNGTSTSDVICNKELQSNTFVTTSPTSNKADSLRILLTSPHPRTGAQNPKMHTTATTTTTTTITTTSASGHTFTPKTKAQPFYPSNTGSHTGMILLVFGIIGLLVLTAVTCRLHSTPYMERQPAIQKNESLCRRPVEESGDGSLSSLKQNPEP